MKEGSSPINKLSISHFYTIVIDFSAIMNSTSGKFQFFDWCIPKNCSSKIMREGSSKQ